MGCVAGVGRTGAAGWPAPTGGVANAAGVPLLPATEAPTTGSMQDAMEALYSIMGQLRDAQANASRGRVNVKAQERDIAAREQAEALKRAREAAEKGGLFDWISKDIGLAGAVGLVTFNYALVAADVAAHKLDLVDNLKIDVVDVGALATGRYDVLAGDILLRKLDIAPKEARELLEKCGIPKDAPGISDEDVRPVAKKLVMANMWIASATATALSAGTTVGLCIALAGLAISTAGGEIAKAGTFDGLFGKGSSQWIGLGMQIYGAAATGMSGLANGTSLHAAVKLGAAAKAGAAATQGTLVTARAADHAVIASNEKTRDDENIKAEQAKLMLLRLERVIDALIDGIKEASESSRKVGESLQGAIATLDQTHLALATGMKG
jgi:hypothetical protein